MRSKKSFLQGALFGALIVLSGAGIVSCGVRLSKDASSEEKVEALKKLIDEKYMGEVDEDALKEGLYKGYVQGLDDPYSVYYDEEETKELYETTEGEYSGIGAVLSQDLKSGVITLVQIYEDSPADKAGLKDEDILTKVGTLDVTGMDLSEVVTYIKGEKGTEVELTVLRGEDADEVTVTAVRDTVEAQTVEYEMLEDQIGYLAVSEFDSVTYGQYEEALEALSDQGMEGLVVDLRNNPGGNLNTVCDMLDLVLPEGTIVYMEDKEGKRQTYSSDDAHQLDVPMAVLVNGNSASASEIYAGAIQDHEAGTIVGTQTYGKGVVQQIFDLGDGTSVKLTIAEYFTPKGRSINGEGVTPDLEVEYEPDEKDPEADNQLEAAAEAVKQAVE
ncbi:S41 family peptidase [Mordavella massiliensis]|jgi:carboxyl-terminal processing protease|uniref:S41 family peptidase n=1 Tax=Mordavella massiliensis TaxID=1871024 RepID=A0A938X4E8_9CLOT|nr:S41 family peptidase [Mordavella massiliensis]MBM6827324.1 S41 family peptidase [Mordavella massiliensis]HJB87690.1 S41 family peptidase [Candidatus Dorea faecigallinarum]